MNWRRTEGHDKTVSECFPCLWPEINEEIAGKKELIMWLLEIIQH